MNATGLRSKAGAAQPKVNAIVDKGDQAKAGVAKAEAALEEAKRIERQAEAAADETATRAILNEGSDADANAAADRLRAAQQRREICERALNVARQRVADAEREAIRLREEAEIALLKLLLKKWRTGRLTLKEVIAKLAEVFGDCHADDENLRKFWNGKPPAGSMIPLATLVALEFARLGNEPLYGGQPQSTRPNLPGAASRPERERAKIEGRPGGIIETTDQAAALMLREFEAGEISKISE